MMLEILKPHLVRKGKDGVFRQTEPIARMLSDTTNMFYY